MVATIESEPGAVVAGPDIVSRGFVYVRESEELLENARQLVKDTLLDCQQKEIREWSALKIRVKDDAVVVHLPEDQAGSDDPADYHGDLRE